MIKVLIFLALVAASLASHGRYGTIQFTKNPSNARQITFTFDAAFRRTYFSGPPNVGSTVTDAQFNFGDGTAQTIPLTVTAIPTGLDVIIVKWVGTHTYANAGDYTVGWSSCCRIAGLRNNPEYSYAHTAFIHLTAAEVAGATPNNSPSSSFPPITTIPYNVVPHQYTVTATDPEGDAITFAQATPAQQGDSRSTQPTGMTLTSAGVATLNSVLSIGYWTTQQIIHDSFGNWISLDYLLDVQPPATVCSGCTSSGNPQCTTNADCAQFCQNSTCVQPEPRMIVNAPGGPTPNSNRHSPLVGSVFDINVGDTIVLDFVADDAKLFQPSTGVTINFFTTPAGSQISAQTECNSASSCTCVGCNTHPQVRSLSYTAPAAASGTGNIVCVTVSSFGNPIPAPNNPWCVTINVLATPVTTQSLTTESLTTQELTTQPLTTQPLTTSFATVADRCATYSFPETQGFFCAADQSGYYQCLKGPWASQAAYRPCPAGTFCRCAVGVECSANGLCTF